MTDIIESQVRDTQSERLAKAILDAVHKVFLNPDVVCKTAPDGASAVVFHGFFAQVQLSKYPSGKVLLTNFPEPCRTLDLTEIASQKGLAGRYSPKWWVYLARGLRDILKPENMLEIYRREESGS